MSTPPIGSNAPIGGTPGPQVPANQQITVWLQQLDAAMEKQPPEAAEIDKLQAKLSKAESHMPAGPSQNLLSQILNYLQEYQNDPSPTNLQSVVSSSNAWMNNYGPK
jgi:hypothetical protein